MSRAATRDVGTLLEALPYIREFHGRTVVIKYGGAAMNDPELREEFARDVVLLKYVGLNPVVVHGGGPEITALHGAARHGRSSSSAALRVSDAQTVEVAKMVLVGKVNKDIVLRINRHGQPAVGLCGDDGALFRAVTDSRRPTAQDIGFVGRIERVDTGVLNHIAAGLHPGRRVGRRRPRRRRLQHQRRRGGRRGRAGARRLQGDVPDRRRGLAARPGRPVSGRLRGLRRRGRGGAARRSSGGMRPKLQACLDAIHGGVTFAHIVDGRDRRTRCCWSCSPTPASARRSGPAR